MGDYASAKGGFDTSVSNIISWTVSETKIIGEAEVINNTCTGVHAVAEACSFDVKFSPTQRGESLLKLPLINQLRTMIQLS